MIINDDLFKGKYRILADDVQYVLERVSISEKGIETWRSIGYYNTLAGVIRAFVRIEVTKNNSVATLKEYVTRYESAYKEIKEKLNI